MNENLLQMLEAREEMEYLIKKRKRRKRILAFILAIAMLVTFAVPLSMMFPNTQISDQKKDNAPLYSACIDFSTDKI